MERKISVTSHGQSQQVSKQEYLKLKIEAQKRRLELLKVPPVETVKNEVIKALVESVNISELLKRNDY